MRPDPMEIPIGMAYDIIGSTWNEKCHQQGVIITLAAVAVVANRAGAVVVIYSIPTRAAVAARR